MKYLFTSIIFIFSQLAFAQNNWPPVGAYWNYVGDTIANNGNMVDAQLTVYVVDTIEINGFIHKITRQVGHEIINDGFTDIVNNKWDEQVCCLLNRNDSIFNVSPHFGNEHFLYSFKSQKGDSIIINQDYPYVVDSISTIYLGLDTFKRINYLKKCPKGDVGAFIIDQVGPLSIEDTIPTDSVCITGSGNSFEWHFKCYSDSKKHYPNPCNVLKTEIEYLDVKKDNINVWFKGNLLRISLEFSLSGSVTIFNLGGMEILKKRFNSISGVHSIDLSSLKNGFYLAHISTTDGNYKILKIVF